MSSFRNTHLSYSRLSRYEQCPLSYRLHYVDGHEAEPDVPLRFGKAIHATLERMLREAVEAGRPAPLSETRAIELLGEAWGAEGLSGFALFSDGIEIVKRFICGEGIVDVQSVLGIETAFELPVGPFSVRGFIDRVNRIDDETIEIIDYKTNRQLYTREQVDASLQMSIYQLAAKKLWPWAKNVELTFWMLRHGVQQRTSRTEEQLRDTLAYVEMLGRQTESDTEFPPRLNANCIYCDHRSHCPAYADALQAKRSIVCEDTTDLEAVAREREEVAKLTKVLNARKLELETVLKAHLKNADELKLAGVRYRMFNVTSLEYPLEPTLSLLADATGIDRGELLERLVSVDHKALEALLKDLGAEMDAPRISLLKAELDAHARKKHSPRFWAVGGT